MKKYENKTKLTNFHIPLRIGWKGEKGEKCTEVCYHVVKIFSRPFFVCVCVGAKKFVISQLSYTLFISEKCLQRRRRRWLGFASFPLVSCNIFRLTFDVSLANSLHPLFHISLIVFILCACFSLPFRCRPLRLWNKVARAFWY